MATPGAGPSGFDVDDIAQAQKVHAGLVSQAVVDGKAAESPRPPEGLGKGVIGGAALAGVAAVGLAIAGLASANFGHHSSSTASSGGSSSAGSTTCLDGILGANCKSGSSGSSGSASGGVGKVTISPPVSSGSTGSSSSGSGASGSSGSSSGGSGSSSGSSGSSSPASTTQPTVSTSAPAASSPAAGGSGATAGSGNQAQPSVTTVPPSGSAPASPSSVVVSAPLLSVVGSPADASVAPPAANALDALAAPTATPTDPTPGSAFCSVVGANGQVTIRTGQTTCSVSAPAGPGAYALGFGAGNTQAQPASAADPSTTADPTSAVPVVVGANGSLGVVNVPVGSTSGSGSTTSTGSSGATVGDPSGGSIDVNVNGRSVACALKSPSTLRSQLAASTSPTCQLLGSSFGQTSNLLADLLSGTGGLSNLATSANQSQLAAQIQQQIASLASQLQASGASPAAELAAISQLEQQIATELQQAGISLGATPTAALADLAASSTAHAGSTGSSGSSAANGAAGSPGVSSVDASALSGGHIEVSVDGSTVTCSLVGANGAPITQVKGTGSQGCQLLEGAPGQTSGSLRSDVSAALGTLSGTSSAQAATSQSGTTQVGPEQASSVSGSLAVPVTSGLVRGSVTPVRVLAPA